MEDKVIVTVCGHTKLYDTYSYHYRNRNKNDLAWRKVSEEVGQSEEVCRKKWKSLRDTYLKERRKETEKRSGSAAGSEKKWKYSAVLSFLDPFVSPRGIRPQGTTTPRTRARQQQQQQGSQRQSRLVLLMAVSLGPFCQNLLLLLLPLPALQHLLLCPQCRQEEELRKGLGSSHRRWSGSSWKHSGPVLKLQRRLHAQRMSSSS
ncbi:uncharacterized protein LOC131538616 isoform X2 [Onychostoma macrolepis]|uniref:uncharacterized protein LOC131538616 isoform X2 n=1 Tax=Onychostoma macrolepis TaxID=369639 RepID=UPI00272D2B7E|nr:uncharacterized protein LOC131538616 isoform X2 [Onychostoma macrolepis]